MKRRQILAAAPALAVIPVVATCHGGGATVAASEETPIARLFAEWCRLHDHSNEPGISEDECNRRVEVEVALEMEIQRTPPLNVQDFARKALVDVGFGDFHTSPEFWVEVCALAGVPTSRMFT